LKRLIFFCLTLFLLSPLSAFGGGLENFLASVNIQARADLPGFSAKISTQFGVPVPEVHDIINSVQDPADAFMIFQLGQMSREQPERVMAVYTEKKKQGWGAIARELGIKPGSAEFHALKNGNLSFTGQPAVHGGIQDKGRGKGRGKGHQK